MLRAPAACRRRGRVMMESASVCEGGGGGRRAARRRRRRDSRGTGGRGVVPLPSRRRLRRSTCKRRMTAECDGATETSRIRFSGPHSARATTPSGEPLSSGDSVSESAMVHHPDATPFTSRPPSHPSAARSCVTDRSGLRGPETTTRIVGRYRRFVGESPASPSSLEASSEPLGATPIRRTRPTAGSSTGR